MALKDKALYDTWRGMIRRCTDPSFHKYPTYGGRGVCVYGPWVESFDQFVEDVGTPPSPFHTLDRYPQRDGDYVPGNVRWATPTEQADTRIKYPITIGGRTMALTWWCKTFELDDGVVLKHIKRGVPGDVAVAEAVARKHIWKQAKDAAVRPDYDLAPELARRWLAKQG